MKHNERVFRKARFKDNLDLSYTLKGYDCRDGLRFYSTVQVGPSLYDTESSASAIVAEALAYNFMFGYNECKKHMGKNEK